MQCGYKDHLIKLSPKLFIFKPETTKHSFESFPKNIKEQRRVEIMWLSILEYFTREYLLIGQGGNDHYGT